MKAAIKIPFPAKAAFYPVHFFIALTFLLPIRLQAEETTPQVVQPQPQQSSDGGSDRKSGAGAAKAMAIAGAAMAGMSCIMMMNEARKMPPGKDKNMMMMMAMQQCAQAAQMAANAAQNDDAKKAVSQADVPKMASLPASKAPTQQKAAEDPPMPTPSADAVDTLASMDPIAEPSAISAPVLEDPKITDSGFSGDPGFTNEISISALKPIEASRVDFNEGNKNDTPTITPPGMGGSGFFGGGKPLGTEELKKVSAATETAPVASGKSGRGGKDEEAPASSEGGSAGAKEEGGGSAFDQLLAQLTGGGAPAEGGSTISGGTEIIALPRSKTPGKGPNIFEYASYRYRVATYDESRVLVKRKPEAARSLTSEKTTTVALKK